MRGRISLRTIMNRLSHAIGPVVLLTAASGCSAIAPPAATYTMTSTEMPMPTPTRTSTHTPTITLTPTKSPIPTKTLTPTPVYNAPGNYKFDYCVTQSYKTNSYGRTWYWSLTVCVGYVIVEEDLDMTFGIVYVLTPYDNYTGTLRRPPETYNKGIYLTDDIGSIYPFKELGGCAAEEFVTGEKTGSCTGWFVFPPANPGATNFTFHYRMSVGGVKHEIRNIILVDPI